MQEQWFKDLMGYFPFTRYRQLIADLSDREIVLDLTIGEPREAPPVELFDQLPEAKGWGNYPATRGHIDHHKAVASWLEQRYHLPKNMIDPTRHLLTLSGTKEGLFLMIQFAVIRKTMLMDGIAGSLKPNEAESSRRPIIVLSNPFYHVYKAAGLAMGAEVIAISAHSDGGPKIEQLSEDQRDRLAAIVICNPDNPTGKIISANRLSQLLSIARQSNAIALFDECYSEIWHNHPPIGAVEIARDNHNLSNMVFFNSLSKRSAATGLRVGFVCGDEQIIESYHHYRSYGAAVPPNPLQETAIRLWQDESHVEEFQKLHSMRRKIAQEVLGRDERFKLPEGGFFLWLNVGNGEEFAYKLFKRFGIKVLPGQYLGAIDPYSQTNPGFEYIRIAMVDTPDLLKVGLQSIYELMKEKS